MGKLDGIAGTVVDKFETHVPSYKGKLARNFLDLVLTTLYFAFVSWIVVRLTLFGVKKGLSIFCCVFCCGCCRRGNKDATKGKKGSAADAKASPKQQPKAKAGKK